MKGRLLDLAVPLAVLAAALYSHFWWLGHFHVPPEGDHGFHLAEAAAFEAVMRSPGSLADKLVAAWSWPGPYSSFVYAVTWAFGASGSQGALASFAFFIAVMVFGAYWIGRDLAGPATGAAAALLACMDPILLNNQRRYFLDMPLAAMVVLALALLLRARGFSNRPWSLAFGVVMGLGILTKYTFIWYLVPAVLVVLVGAARGQALRAAGVIGFGAAALMALNRVSFSRHFYLQGSDSLAPTLSYLLIGAWVAACILWWLGARRWLEGTARNAAQALCLAGLVAGPWIIVNQFMIRGRWLPVAQTIPHNLANLKGTLASFLQGVPPPVLVLAALGLLAVLLVRQRRALLPLVAAVVLGLAATVVVLPNTPRYTIPVSVLLGVLAVAWMPPVRWAPLFLALVAAQLAFVNLFGESARLAYPERAVELERVSGLTRRTLADGMGYRTDFEVSSRRAIQALPKDAATLYVLSPDESRLVELCDFYYMLSAYSDWQGRVTEVRLMRPQGKGFSHVHVNPVATDRTRFLARRNGLPLDRFPRITDGAPAPDAMLVADGAPTDRLFGGTWRALAQVGGFMLMTRGAPAPGAAARTEDLMAPIEEEMAARLERRQSFTEDEALFRRLYDAARKANSSYPARLWLAMFSPRLQQRIDDPELKPSPRDRLALAYLTEVLDPKWSLRIAAVTRNPDETARQPRRGREACPPQLRAAYEATAVGAQYPDSLESWSGVTHLLSGSHEESRSHALAVGPLAAAREVLGDLAGRDLADVGSGSGPTLGDFRRAIGPQARLYSVELDGFALHVMQHMARGLDVRAVQGALDDTRLPPESVDWIVMTGVHLGSGLGLRYERETLPWLRSMARALRPGGILIIDDGNMDLLSDGMTEKVERAGFSQVMLRREGYQRHVPGFIAVYRVKK